MDHWKCRVFIWLSWKEFCHVFLDISLWNLDNINPQKTAATIKMHLPVRLLRPLRLWPNWGASTPYCAPNSSVIHIRNWTVSWLLSSTHISFLRKWVLRGRLGLSLSMLEHAKGQSRRQKLWSRLLQLRYCHGDVSTCLEAHEVNSQLHV